MFRLARQSGTGREYDGAKAIHYKGRIDYK